MNIESIATTAGASAPNAFTCLHCGLEHDAANRATGLQLCLECRDLLSNHLGAYIDTVAWLSWSDAVLGKAVREFRKRWHLAPLPHVDPPECDACGEPARERGNGCANLCDACLACDLEGGAS